MARTARKPKDDDSSVVKAKDFELAKKLYFNDAKPAISKASEYMQEASTCYKAIKKQAHIQPGAFKTAMKVVEMEDAKAEDWLRCFNGVLRSNNVDPDPKDMVDVMQAGDDGYARPKPQLVTINPDHPADDSDLANPDGEEPTEGTGAAAIAAMRAADAAAFDKVEEGDLTH